MSDTKVVEDFTQMLCPKCWIGGNKVSIQGNLHST